jgi:hypothetical protein
VDHEGDGVYRMVAIFCHGRLSAEQLRMLEIANKCPCIAPCPGSDIVSQLD